MVQIDRSAVSLTSSWTVFRRVTVLAEFLYMEGVLCTYDDRSNNFLNDLRYFFASFFVSEFFNFLSN